MIVMGCDASLTCTGISAIQLGHISADFKPDNSQVFTTTIEPVKMRGLERLKFIRNEFSRHLRTLAPAVVVFEGYARGATTYREEMGEVQGILRMRTFDEGTEVLIVTPQGLKKFATSKGNGDKSVVRACVERRWGLVSDNITHDEVDAYVLMMVGAAIKKQFTLASYQTDVIKTTLANPHGEAKGKKKAVTV